MARTLFLHIGTMKSGTTYLQEVCELHRDALAAGGLWWPRTPRYRAVRDLLDIRLPDEDATGTGEALIREMADHPGDVLLSNEMMAALSASQARRLVARLPCRDLRVIITARDLGRVVSSQWQTGLKSGGSSTWREFSSAVCDRATGEEQPQEQGPAVKAARRFWRHHDLADVITRWSEPVSTSQISLVTVPSGSRGLPDAAGADPSDLVLERVGGLLGTDLVRLDRTGIRRNQSLGAVSAALLSYLNRTADLSVLSDRRLAVRSLLSQSILEPRAASEPSFGLDQHQQDQIRTLSQRMLSKVKDSGVAVIGGLDELIPEERARSDLVDPGDVSKSDLLALAAEALLVSLEDRCVRPNRIAPPPTEDERPPTPFEPGAS